MPAASTWMLVDPIALPSAAAAAAATETATGPIRRVGFLSNSKQHAAEIEAAMAEAMATAFAIEPRFYRKPTASVGATAELLRAMAAECDAAIVGSAD
jgi:hypothetical protein